MTYIEILVPKDLDAPKRDSQLQMSGSWFEETRRLIIMVQPFLHLKQSRWNR